MAIRSFFSRRGLAIEALRARGIVVTNTPDFLSKATAEITLLLILAVARRAGEGDKLVRSGNWGSRRPSFMLVTQVTDRTLGIIGMGRVALALAKLVKGFDMKTH